MKRWLTVFLALGCLSNCLAADIASPAAKDAPPVMRAPFTLTLHVDRDHFYEEKIGEMPYVYRSGIYLMKGDKFGVAVDIRDGKVTAVTYQPDLDKADITFDFDQKVESDGSSMMMLTIHNRTAFPMKMRALMTVPGEKKAIETSILPIDPGLSDYESWPHPIVKLLVHDIQIGN